MNQFTLTTEKLSAKQVDIVDRISAEEFYSQYVDKGRPVVIRNLTSEWKALEWDTEYFKARENGLKLAVKTGNVAEGKREMMTVSEYVELLEEYEEKLHNGGNPVKPAYLHDVPFFHLFPHMVADIEPFPTFLFPKWYHEKWHNYIQFFMGSTNSLTPLHFDTLCTHNLFFQIVGKKKFILIPKEQKDNCYMEGWRWAKFNPSNPDYKEFPLAKDLDIAEVVIGPGDILYIPSGMLHQVHGLSYSISFNIDWHTAKSAREGIGSLMKGAPMKNAYYNLLSYMGVSMGIPSKYLFPYYKSYLNYVS